MVVRVGGDLRLRSDLVEPNRELTNLRPVEFTRRLIRLLPHDLVEAIARARDPLPPPATRRLGRLVQRPWFAAGSALIAALLLIGTWADLHPVSIAVVLSAVHVLPLYWLVRKPLLAWRVGILTAVFTPWLVGSTFDWAWNAGQTLLMLAVLYVVATRHPRRILFWIWALTEAVVWAYSEVAEGIISTIVLTGVMVVGDNVQRRRQAVRELEAQSQISEQEKARRAVLEERSRIAREMHDVVAHRLSVIAVQAETAQYRLPELPATAVSEFTSLSASARAALTEMRRLLGVLRSEDTEADLAPQPGLAALDELIDGFQRAGVAAHLTVVGDVIERPDSVELSAYRIVQEAVSNAARHAPGSMVDVVVRHHPSAVDIVVRNSQPEVPVTSNGVRGHGLVGMRERAATLGGTCHAGVTPDGGFEVRAQLPVSEQGNNDDPGDGGR